MGSISFTSLLRSTFSRKLRSIIVVSVNDAPGRPRASVDVLAFFIVALLRRRVRVSTHFDEFEYRSLQSQLRASQNHSGGTGWRGSHVPAPLSSR